MGDCVHEDRIIELVKATEANTVQLGGLAISIDNMQKWFMGFIISAALLIVGIGFNNYLTPTSALAKDCVKNNKVKVEEIKSNE